MQREVVSLQGLQPLLSNLDLTSKQIGIIAGDAMEFAADSLESTIQLNALRILRAAEAKGYRRKKGKHLYQTIGHRLKYYKNKASILVAVGPIYRQGGWHSHLVEFGHRIVRGGTLAPKPDWTPELIWNAKLKTMVFKYGAPRRTKTGRTHKGKVVGVVAGKPFQEPAWGVNKSKVLSNFENAFKQSLQSLVDKMKT